MARILFEYLHFLGEIGDQEIFVNKEKIHETDKVNARWTDSMTDQIGMEIVRWKDTVIDTVTDTVRILNTIGTGKLPNTTKIR